MASVLPSWRVGRSALVVVAALFLVVAQGHSAQAAKRRVGVVVTGPHASGLRGAIDGALGRHGLEATSADLPGEGTGAIADAAKRDKLAAVVVGQVGGGGKHLKLRVYGATGDVLDEASFSAPNVHKLEIAVERTLWTRVGAALAKARPAAEKADKSGAAAEEAAPAEKPRAEEAPPPAADEGEAPAPRKHKKKRARQGDEEDEEPTSPAATALDLAVGLRFVSRHFTWSPPVQALRGYSLGFAPSVGGSLAWYPLARSTGGWASNLGVAGWAEYTPGLTSQASDGSTYPTSESDFWGGVRGRVPFAIGEVALTLGGGQQTFVFRSSDTAMRSNLSDLPDVKYTYGRAGLDLRLTLPANVSVMLGAGYRHVFSAGTDNYLIQAYGYFQDSSFTAFDATAAAGYRFLSFLEARVGFDIRRYQMSAGTNNYMVTGATDQYLAFWGQLALLIDGYAGGAAASSPPRPAPAREEPDEPAGGADE